MARVSVVGRGIAKNGELMHAVSVALRNVGGKPVWRAPSKMRVSSLLPRVRVEEAVTQLHERLGLNQPEARPSENP